MRRKNGLLVAVVALLAFLSGVSVTQAQGDTTWTGEYFNNPYLSGSPVLVRADLTINFLWGMNAPASGLPADLFSVRWTQTQFFAGGTYRFTARSDDGMRVYLDNVVILDSWYDRAPDPPAMVEVIITAGLHVVRVEYYENGGSAVASLNWIPISSLGVATWTAQYYNNMNLVGPATVERTEQTIDYDWGFGSPAPGQIAADYFSVRWTASPYFAAGTYTFTIFADDGVRLWIDNQIVIDHWRGKGFTPPDIAAVTLGEGQHTLRLEYFEQLEVAAIRVEWAATGAPAPTPVPTIAPATGVWQADYFNNTALSGPPVYSTTIATPGLNLNWQLGSPAATVVSDNFSARFTSRATFPGGLVHFVLRADDGVRLYFDGVLALDEWHTASGDYYFLDYDLASGEHTLTLEFYESTIQAQLRFYWLYPRPARAGTAVIALVNASQLNVRSGPSTAYPVLGRARQNQVFTVTGRSTSDPRWVRINFGSFEGWINGTWTTLQGDQATVPNVPIAEEAGPPAVGF